MTFNTFLIKRQEDDVVVDIRDLDRLVCEKFGLSSSGRGCGRFVPTELHEVMNMSWLDMIGHFLFHSGIEWSKNTTYDINAAMVWGFRSEINDLPESAVKFINALMDFLCQSGLYIFIQIHDYNKTSGMDRCESINEFILLKSESGFFICDECGMVLRFYPLPDNVVNQQIALEEGRAYWKYDVKNQFYIAYEITYSSLCVKRLIVPRGVKSFSDFFFFDGLVQECMELPDTLLSIGAQSAFCGAVLPDVVIPDGVHDLGNSVFAASQMRSLQLPRGLKWEYKRQFNDSHIGTLYLPYSREEYDNDCGLRCHFAVISVADKIVYGNLNGVQY